MKTVPRLSYDIVIKPIRFRKWFTVFISSSALTGFALKFFLAQNYFDGKPWSFWLLAVALPFLICLMALLTVILVQQFKLQQKELLQEYEQQWWQYQQACLPVKEAIIVGSAGKEQIIWKNLLINKPEPAAAYSINTTSPILRCPYLMDEILTREEMLSKGLAFKFLEADSVKDKQIEILTIFWLGNQTTYQQFLDIIASENLKPTHKPHFINSIDELDQIIDFYKKQPIKQANQMLLVAGVSLPEPVTGKIRAETSFAWCIQKEADYAVYRSEILKPQEEASTLATQVVEYAQLKEPPKLNISMSQQSTEKFNSSALHTVEHSLENYFGDVNCKAQPFIAISQALIHCINHAEAACGWSCGDVEKEAYVAGVIAKKQPA
ncbi:hypothetical protein VQ643_14605 [Pseudomonas sp. F1_0610]|uniref:hypothetical protein n=1 Tax=Pseudomonas sp. F1_0610 TaxID=3114284 RepID=UPI0039C0D221